VGEMLMVRDAMPKDFHFGEGASLPEREPACP
jgi:hypothetical protein